MRLLIATLVATAIVCIAAPSEVGDLSYREGFSMTEFPIVNLTSDAPAPVPEGEDSIPTKARSLEKRQSYGGPQWYGFYYCNAAYFSHSEGCREDWAYPGSCYNLPVPCFADQISSFSVGAGLRCEMYDTVNCSPRGGVLTADIVEDGIQELWSYGWDNRISSFRCFPA